MATFVEDLFGKSNRRRCVKGRSSYIEPSDNLPPPEDKPVDNNFNNSEDYSEYDNADNVEVDDADEEAVTIDLSDFLNLNPLLPETSTENAADSGGLFDCHSQFRVTSSVTEPSQIVVKDSTQKEVNLNENVVADEIHAEASFKEPTAVISENGISVPVENSSSEISSENASWKENIVNGAQHSPNKLPKAKFKGRPSPQKNLKTLSKQKAFNKNNVKFFGKYPLVQCEKLDIDNFVKRSKIKVGNWPLLPMTNRKSKPHTIRSIANKKSNPLVIKQNLKPFSRPISFNKFSRSNGTLDRARSILVESLEAKSGMSKAGMAKFQLSALQNFNKTKFGGSETLIKLMPQNISDSQLSNQRQKFPIITSVNKMVGSPKTYHFISPKTNISPFEKNKSGSITPILPKPVVDAAISPVLLKDFTVIQPYVEDPTSPIKPKPILTVPLDIVPTIETVNTHAVANTSIISPVRPMKPAQSVFLNGAIQQISIPKKIGNKTPRNNKADKSFNKIAEKIVKSPVSATSVVVDAMQSVFDKLSTKKTKPKQVANKINLPPPVTGFSSLGCNAYNSTLNDMIFGFDAFDAESFDLNCSVEPESCDLDVTNTVPDTTVTQSDLNQKIISVKEDVSESSGQSVTCKVKKRRKTVQSVHDSDTWSASEGEDPTQIRMSYTARRRQRKSSNTSDNKKVKRSSSSHLKSAINNQDSDSSDKIPSITANKKSPEKFNENHLQCSNDNSLFSEKNSKDLGHISNKPISHSQLSPDHENEDLVGNFESSTNSNLQSSEVTSSIDEIVHTGKGRTKFKIDLNLNSSKDLPQKQSAKKTKQKPTLPFAKGKRRFQTRFLGKSTVKKTLSRPADIIKEINTITGANLSGNKKKKGKAFSIKETDSDRLVQSNGENKSDSLNQKKSLRTKTKKKGKTIKVLFQKPKTNTRSVSLQDDANNSSDCVNDLNSLSEMNSDSNINDIKSENLTTPNVENENKEETSECVPEVSSNEPKSTETVEIDACQAKQLIENANEIASTNSKMNFQTKFSEISEGLCNSPEIYDTQLNPNLDVDLSTNKDNIDTLPNKTNLAEVPINDSNINDLSSQTEVNSLEDGIDSTICTKTTLPGVNLVLTEKSVLQMSCDSKRKEIGECIEEETNSADVVDTSLSNEISSSESKLESPTNQGTRSRRTSRNNRISKSDAIDINDCLDTTSATTIEPLQLSESDEVKMVERTRRNSSVAEKNITFETTNTSLVSESKKRGRPRKSCTSDSVSEVDSANSSISQCTLPTSDGDKLESIVATELCDIKKRGRPKKNSKSDTVSDFDSVNSSISKDSLQTSENDACETNVHVSGTCESKKLGRPKKNLESNIDSNNIDSANSLTVSVCSSASEIDEKLETSYDSETSNSKKPGRPKRNLKSNRVSDADSVGTTKAIDDLLVTEKNPALQKTLVPGKAKVGRPKKNSKVSITTEKSEISDKTATENLLSLEIKVPNQIDSTTDKKPCRNKRNLKSDSTREMTDISDTNITRVSTLHASLSLENNELLEDSSIKEGEVAEKNKKKCQKVKISVAKPITGSNKRSLKNWYVSERKASTDSIPSDEITVLKPNERAEFKKAKEIQTTPQNRPPISVETSDNERSNESRTFVINAIVHVDATDIPDDTVTPSLGVDKVNLGVDGSKINDDSIVMNQTIITDILNSMIRDIEIKTKSDPLPSPKGHVDQMKTVPPIQIKQEPIDPDEASEAFVTSTVPVKLEEPYSSKASNKRKLLPSSKIMEGFAAAVKRASTPKNKASKKIKLQPSTPELASTSTPPMTAALTQSAPAKMRSKKFSYEAVTLPFKMGWMRELVHRANYDAKSGKKQSDIYYFTPEGTKLRSMVDISNYLSKQPESKLTLENFTYAKELIYREPFEIERSAKQKPVVVTNDKKDPPKSAPTPKQKSTPTLKPKSTPTPKQKPTPTPKQKPTSYTPKINTVFPKAQTPASTPKTSAPKSTTAKSAPKNATDSSLSESVCDVNDSLKEDSAASLPSKRQIKRRVPFDNSSDETSTSKKTKIVTRRHSATVSSSDLKNEIFNEIALLSKSTFNTTLSENTSAMNVTQNSGATILKVPQSQTLKKPPPKKAQFKAIVPKYNYDVSFESPCSARCMVPNYVAPSIQCIHCLCLFHPQCYPRSARDLLFQCKPCMAAKRRLYESVKSVPVSSTNVTVEDIIPDIPDDLDMTMLSPEVSLQFPHLLSPPCNTSSITNNVAFHPIIPVQEQPVGIVKTSTSTAASPLPVPRGTSNLAPHLLSHLLQTNNLPMTGSFTPISPQQMASTSLPTSLKNSPNTRMYRVRLPLGAGVTLPNQLVIRMLPDRRIMVCSTAPPQFQNKVNVGQAGPLQMPKTGWVPKAVKTSGNSNSDTNKQSTNIEVLTSPTTSSPRNYSKKAKLTDRPANIPSKNECQPKPPNVIKSAVGNSKRDEEWDKERFMKSVECLNLVFKRLDVYDLLRATEVSTSWRILGQLNSLWEKVSFRGLTITDWQKCCIYLQKRGTKFLDLRDIIHPNVFQPWVDLEINVTYLSKIEELIIDHLPPSLLKAIISNMPLLRRFECHFVTAACTEPEIWSTPCEIELEPFRCLGRLVRLKIGSGGGITLGSGSKYIMPYLPNLRHVALTGFDFHSHVNLEFLSQLNDLISLELGNISSIEPGIYPLLGTLTNLKSLRLENGGDIDEVKFSEALSKMERLEVLELMNFKISARLADSLKKLKQIIHINVWPDTTTESAIINQNLFAAMSSVTDLKYLCWGVIAQGDSAPDVLQLRHTDKSGEEKDELTFEDLFKRLVDMFTECRVEVKCVPRKLWREFCSTRK